MISSDVFLTILKIAAVFIGVSFIVFWVGLVWWVAQDVLSRTEDKIIIAAAVAMTAILGPVGALLYLVIRPKQTLQESMGEMMEREMLLHASSTTICPTCGRMALEDFLSCPHCATQLKEHCPQCQKLVSVEWSHCPYCAAKLQPKRSPEQAGRRSAAHQPLPLATNEPAKTIPNTTPKLSAVPQTDLDKNSTSTGANSALSRTQALTKASASAVHQSTKTSIAILKDVFSATRSNLPTRQPYANDSQSSASTTLSPAGKPASQPKITPSALPEGQPATKSMPDHLSSPTPPSVKAQTFTSANTRRPKNQRGSKK